MLGAEYESGGAGAFGTLASYLKILAAVANGGVGPNGARILEEATVRAMFQDQADVVPEWKEAIREKGVDLNALVTGVQGYAARARSPIRALTVRAGPGEDGCVRSINSVQSSCSGM